MNAMDAETPRGEGQMTTYTVGDFDKRPWGSWSVIAAGTGFAVKQIVVRPGAKLSLQRHQWRAEHWIVVQGAAEITLDAETRNAAENTAVFIPCRSIHRIANNGPADLVLIEVQYGARLEETDIERLDDIYGRS